MAEVTQVQQHRPVVSRTQVTTDAPSETKPFKLGKPVAYTATEGVYVDGAIFKPGEVFVTDKPKGLTWDEVDPKERAAADAGKPIPDDVNLDALNVPALKAHAAAKQINIGEAKSKADLIAVIKAAREPAL